MSIDSLDARACAYQALQAFIMGRTQRVGDFVDESGAALPARDRALARELALGVLRWQRLYDALAARFLRPGQQPEALSLTLRLIAHQLFALDRIPPRAAVHGGIELLRSQGEQRLTGVANAVARRLSELRLAERRDAPGPHGRIPERELPADPGQRWSLPDPLVRRLLPALPGNGEAVLAALNQPPPLCTRLRPGREAALSEGDPAVMRREGSWCWWRRSEAALSGPVADRVAVVQDRGQGHVLELLDALPPGRAIDSCAAPGGKSLALLDRAWRVLAGDSAVGKLGDLRAAIGRNVVVGHDGRQPAFADGCCDLVLVDAPRSNTAVLARRPEARWRFSERELSSLCALQDTLLRAALPLLRPGGHVLYATCSLLPAENGAIPRRVGLRIIAERTIWPDEWQMGGYGALCVLDV